MLENNSIIFLDEEITKTFNEFTIILISKMDSLTIKIQKNLYNIYESTFNISYLNSFDLLKEKWTIQEIIKLISNYIDQKQIQIQENENNLKFILISENNSNIELIINQSSKLSEEIIEKLIKQIEILQNKNEAYEKENIIREKEIKNLQNLYSNKIKEMEEKIKKLESINQNEKKYKKEKNNSYNLNCSKNNLLKEIEEQKNKFTKFNLKKVNSIIDINEEQISSISIFPSGDLISVSYEQRIKIYDKNNYNIIQNIKDQYNDDKHYILDIKVINENNFVTCSTDGSIRTWIKKNNIFKINQIINNAHSDYINKLIYCSNGFLISCSLDKTIKIWKENNNKYVLIKILYHSNSIWSILLLENKNILISSGLDGTKVWNFNMNEIRNCKMIKYFDNVYCCYSNALDEINGNKIIVGGNEKKILKIISINEEKIIKEIQLSFKCYGIKNFEDKKIFLVGGTCNHILMFRNDNYECLKIIKDAHYKYIYGFVELKRGLLASFSYDNIINIWSFVQKKN